MVSTPRAHHLDCHPSGRSNRSERGENAESHCRPRLIGEFPLSVGPAGHRVTSSSAGRYPATSWLFIDFSRERRCAAPHVSDETRVIWVVFAMLSWLLHAAKWGLVVIASLLAVSAKFASFASVHHDLVRAGSCDVCRCPPNS